MLEQQGLGASMVWSDSATARVTAVIVCPGGGSGTGGEAASKNPAAGNCASEASRKGAADATGAAMELVAVIGACTAETSTR